MNTLDTKIQRLVPVQPPIAILGVPFDNVTSIETVALIEQMIATRQPHYLVTANVDFLVQAQNDVELRHILNDAHLVLCDGTPVMWASRLLGNRLPERVAGADLVPVLLKVAAEKQYRVFLLGATPDSVEAAAARLKKEHPSLLLAGIYSPPFARLLEMDHEEIKKRVREANPDILFVAFGCPKAEKWIAMHYRAMGVPVVAGVGATIDFLAGRVKRAPVWMRKAGMEWIFRLGCEPRRLFKRYMHDLWGFGWRIVAQWVFLQWYPKMTLRKTRMLAGRWWDSARNVGRHYVLDMSGIQYVDSTDLGLLLVMHKKLRGDGRHFVLASVTPGVQQALRLMRLKDHFAIAPSIPGAVRLIEDRTLEESAIVTRRTVEGGRCLQWHGEITAVNAIDYWNHTRDMIAGAGRTCPVSIDLSQARIVDSTGLTTMLKIQQWAWQNGITLVFTGAQPEVLDVLKMSQFDQLLTEKPELSGLIAESFVSTS